MFDTLNQVTEDLISGKLSYSKFSKFLNSYYAQRVPRLDGSIFEAQLWVIEINYIRLGQPQMRNMSGHFKF